MYGVKQRERKNNLKKTICVKLTSRTRYMTYKIIDNVLSKPVADKISHDLLCDRRFPWYYLDTVVSNQISPGNMNNYQFVHIFYNQYNITGLYSVIAPIVDYLNPEAIVRIKANLNPKTEVRHTFEYHTDLGGKSNDRKTAIYYVNSNDGVTILEDGTEIESIANRLVIFDQKTFHTGTTCTNQKVRCVINFNYIEWND
jgi:hypothetical protein